MSHSPAGRRTDARNEADRRLVLLVLALQEFGGVLLGAAADLTDHDDTISLIILEEDAKAVDEVGAGKGVTADADDKRLAQPGLGGLIDSFVGQGAGTRDDADTPTFVDETGHDANLALAWSDDARAVGADETGLALRFQHVRHADHVVLGNAFGDADH